MEAKVETPETGASAFFHFQKEHTIMATEKQIAANRRNARKSTGPTSIEGKTKTKFNAVKHGMTARVAVLPYEDPHSYEHLRQSFIDDYAPANAREYSLVELAAINYWRLLRMRRVETASFDLHIKTIKDHHDLSGTPTFEDDGGLASAFATPHDAFRKLERYTIAVERSYFRAIDTLRRLQNDRERREKIGFVSQPAPLVAAAGRTTGESVIGTAPEPAPFRPSVVTPDASWQSPTPIRSEYRPVTATPAGPGPETAARPPAFPTGFPRQ